MKGDNVNDTEIVFLLEEGARQKKALARMFKQTRAIDRAIRSADKLTKEIASTVRDIRSKLHKS